MSAAPEPDVLLVDDDEDIRASLSQTLELAGLTVAAFARAETALERLGPDFAGAVVSDIRMPRMDGLAFLQAALQRDAELPVILITGHGDVPLAVDALRRGAWDFIEKPFPSERLTHAIARALERRRMSMELRALRRTPPPDAALDALVLGQSPAIQEIKRKLPTIAASPLDVLIVGPTGTGKEHVARAIHALGGDPRRPFATINLAALPAEQVEAELFGHVAGAGPGTARARTGRLEHGRGGTIFLDEISSAPLPLQAKLLRVLEDRAILPLGAQEPVPLGARFIASSRVPLEERVAEGAFRDDLLYRINPVTLRLPPLAERGSDVPRLFATFVALAAREVDRPAPEVTPEQLMRIAARDWPGNLRELRNAADLFVLGLSDEPLPEPPGVTLAEQVERFERDVLARTLAANDGSVKATYESLGLARKTLYEKMQKHGLRREDFKD
ncbi:sigma-54-dependent transcriptional regulator [Pseudoroseicyclus tamaricis]|uniref:Nif-specific regulatory protein n=1 Tax=Pseudoroseicyclus tamaricis TaxID=2705421 RepID=A0A6B2JWX9_9RHOB|nr:sigma-54 dependent transcriptional regulator [Pseudoroseicyclus tamaricis]NDU99861.1 sigma-54-dependent Fis family transcriptional regulator [Pseudoroseicyclus tamaricis]